MKTTLLSPGRAAAVTAVLGLLSLFPPLATDMYLAAMGDLAHAMNSSHVGAELSLSIFFLGLCVGQMLVGALIDGYGRKLPLLIATTLFLTSSAILPFMTDIAIFNTLRFVQAIGASAGMVVGRAIVKDLYQGRQAAKVMTVLVMLLTIGPVISPTLGSILLRAFGWQSIFFTMAAISLAALFLSVLVLPETLPPSRRAARPFHDAARSALRLLGRRSFAVPMLTAGMVQAGMFAFITGSSGIFQGIFGLAPLEYGLVFAVIAAALIVFGRVNSILLNRWSPEQILRIGLPIYMVAGLGLILLSDTTSLWILVAPLWCSIGMVGLLSANAMALAMDASAEAAGTGSAVLGAVQFAIAFGVSSAVALAGGGTPLPMSLGIFVPAVIATLLWHLASRQIKRERVANGI